MKRFALISGLLVFGLLSGVALAACGGGGTPETPIVVTGPTQSLTKDEFIAQADSICDTANTQIATIAAAGGGVTQAAQIAQLRQGVVDAIRNLGTPTGGSTTSTSPSVGSSTTSTGVTTPNTSTSSSFGSTTSSGGSGAGTGTGASATGATSGDPLGTFLAELEAEVKAGEKIGLAGKRGQSTASAEAELTSAKAKAASAASAYGFLKCGTEGTASTATTSTGAKSGTVAPSAPSPSAPSTSVPSSGGGTSPPGSSHGGAPSGGVGPG